MPPTATRPVDAEVARPHLVITVHGIRTFGQWQERLEIQLKTADPLTEVSTTSTGYFSLAAFLIPFLRWLVTRRFRQALLRAASQKEWRRIDIVAHSFGTHLVGWGLYGIPPEHRPRIHTIILAGSVLKHWFPWGALVGRSVRRLVNECGTRDSVLLWNQICVLFTGMAGRVGFAGMTGDDFRNRFFDVGHSGYFQNGGLPDDTFMVEHWMPLLAGDGPVLALADPRSPRAIRGFQTFLLNNAEPMKLAAYITPLLVGILWVNGLRMEAVRQARIAVGRQLGAQAELTRTLQGRLIERSVLLALESARRVGSSETDQALRNGLRLLAEPVVKIPHSRTVEALAISPDGDRLAVVDDNYKTATLYRLSTGAGPGDGLAR